jgi:hypothetical protein
VTLLPVGSRGEAAPSEAALCEATLCAALEREFPGFRLVPKRGNALSEVIHVLLLLATFGAQRRYLTDFHTVIGRTLYVPDSWQRLPEVDRVILLLHERVHLLQVRRLTFLGMALVYLLPFFPLGLAYGRARLEWEAFAVTLRATAELKGLGAARALRPAIVRRFCSGDYGWMWPFPVTVNRWYDRVIAQIEAEIDGGRLRTADGKRENS